MSSFMVKLEDISFGKRQRKEYKNILELGESLKKKQIHNIVVRKPDEGEDSEGRPWMLVAGGRRCTAAMAVGIEELRAEDFEGLPPDERKIIELEENLQRENINYAELVAAKAEIHELLSAKAVAAGLDWSQKQTAAHIGETTANVSRDLKLYEAMKVDPSLKNATSKKAAVRAVEMKEHTKRMIRQIALVNETGVDALKSRLRNVDARELVSSLAPKSVDLCFTDFPFGLEASAGARGYNEGMSKYDDSRESSLKLIEDIVPSMLRMMKPTGWLALIMNWELHFELRSFIENCCVVHHEYAEGAGTPLKRPTKGTHCSKGRSVGTMTDCRFIRAEEIPWIWWRPNSQNNPEWPDLHAQNQYELILVANMGLGKLVTSTEGKVGNVLAYDAEYKSRHHSMQKPPGLCEEVVRRLTVGGQLVVDLCFGSGSGLRAAAKLGRDFLGSELNPSLVELATGYVAEVWKGATGAGPALVGVGDGDEDEPVVDEDELSELAEGLDDDQGDEPGDE